MNDKTSPEREDGYWAYKVQMTSGGWVWFPLSSTQIVCAGGGASSFTKGKRTDGRMAKSRGLLKRGNGITGLSHGRREKKKKKRRSRRVSCR